MPTVVLTYTFNTTVDGWVGVDDGTGSNSPFRYQWIAAGSPLGTNTSGGSLRFYQNASEANPSIGHFYLSGSWTSFGVPPTATVNTVKLSVDENSRSSGPGVNTTTGPYELRDASNNLLVEMLPGRVVTFGDSGWNTRTQGAVNVPSGAQSPSTNIQFWINCKSNPQTSLTYGNIDNIVITITYTSSGVIGNSASLTATHPTFVANSTVGVPVFTGSATLNAAKSISVSGSSTYVFDSRILSKGYGKKNSIVTKGYRPVVPVYAGAAVLTTNPATSSAYAIYLLPYYTGNASLVSAPSAFAASVSWSDFGGFGGMYSSPAFQGTGTFVPPDPRANGDLIAISLIESTGSFLQGQFVGQSVLLVKPATLGFAGNFSNSAYRGFSSLTAKRAVISVGDYSITKYIDMKITSNRTSTHSVATVRLFKVGNNKRVDGIVYVFNGGKCQFNPKF